MPYGQVAQLVEQRTENPRVVGSIPTLATILALVALAACGSPKVAPHRPDTAALEREIPGLLRVSGVPGLSMAVVEKGRVVWAEAFGTVIDSAQTPLNPGTVFEAASLSKPVFAYLVLRLADRGEFDLDRARRGAQRASVLQRSGEPRVTAHRYRRRPVRGRCGSGGPHPFRWPRVRAGSQTFRDLQRRHDRRVAEIYFRITVDRSCSALEHRTR